MTDFASQIQEIGMYFEKRPMLVLIIIIWTIFWKGVGLWQAAERGHKWWFFFILVLNTLGILEIIYIYFVARKYRVETKSE